MYQGTEIELPMWLENYEYKFLVRKNWLTMNTMQNSWTTEWKLPYKAVINRIVNQNNLGNPD